MANKSRLLICYIILLLTIHQGFSQDTSIVYLNSKSKFINSLCFSKGGSEIVYSDGNNIQIREIADNSLLVFLENGHSDRVLALDISDDSSKVVSGGRDSLIILWDNKGNLIRKLSYHTGKVTTVKFDHTGNLIFSGSTDRRLVCYSLTEDRIIFDKKVHRNDILSIDVSRDGKLLASGGADGKVYILDTRKGDVINNLEDGKNWVRSVRFNSNSTSLATGNDKGSVHLWRIADPMNTKLLVKDKDSPGWVTGLDFFPDNTSYVYSNENGVIGMSVNHTDYRLKIKAPVRMIKIQPGNSPFFIIAAATYGKGLMLIKGSTIIK